MTPVFFQRKFTSSHASWRTPAQINTVKVDLLCLRGTSTLCLTYGKGRRERACGCRCVRGRKVSHAYTPIRAANFPAARTFYAATSYPPPPDPRQRPPPVTPLIHALCEHPPPPTRAMRTARPDHTITGDIKKTFISPHSPRILSPLHPSLFGTTDDRRHE